MIYVLYFVYCKWNETRKRTNTHTHTNTDVYLSNMQCVFIYRWIHLQCAWAANNNNNNNILGEWVSEWCVCVYVYNKYKRKKKQGERDRENVFMFCVQIEMIRVIEYGGWKNQICCLSVSRQMRQSYTYLLTSTYTTTICINTSIMLNLSHCRYQVLRLFTNDRYV